MKTLPSLLLAGALVSATATTAAAYTLSPPDTSARLRGILTFHPNNGTTPTPCKVTLFLKTKKSQIESVKVDTPGACQAIGLGGLPWGVGILNATSGDIEGVSFTGVGGECNQPLVAFQVNSSGVWTLPVEGGSCITGTLVSHPAVTIAQ